MRKSCCNILCIPVLDLSPCCQSPLRNVFVGGDQQIQSVYWMYLRHPSEFTVLPKELWSADDHSIWTYTFPPPVPTASKKAAWYIDGTKHSPMPIVTAINSERSVCATRSVMSNFAKPVPQKK
mmetsp:Transcript_12728/g.20509  ORF Transcript_12728/g.20509 Transcript_12728/m.20509 type:complete len:123 (-) Transcript_12728:154-522(-)